MTVFKRNITLHAQRLLEQFPAVAIIGARQVGKTSLSQLIGKNFTYVDLEKGSDYDRISRDIELFFKQNPSHVIFDEAQLYPEIFATLRGVIDANRQEKGRFIITGSSSPELLENISESLAGRIAIIELGTLKANELLNKPISGFFELFKKPLDIKTFLIDTPPLDFQGMQNAWLQGGYPEPCLANNEAFYQEWMHNYEATYINRDIANLFPKLDKVAFRRFIAMLGELSGKIINRSDLARSINVTEPTISKYIDIAAGTFIWRTLPSFESNVTKRIVKMPRGHIRDSGLLHYLQHIGDLEHLQKSVRAGFTFEAFVIEEILKGLEDSRVSVEAFYYRTYNGAEIDLILQGNFGILPIEIKYGTRVSSRQLQSLSNFIEEQKLPFGLLINQSEHLEWLTDKILQVPAGYL